MNDFSETEESAAAAEDLKLLLIQAAEAGPGWKGERTMIADDIRDSLILKIQSAGGEAPPYLVESREWIDRSAKLFESGDYPDKGASISEEDLLQLEQSFSQPVPVLIEHSKSPLELGFLTDIRAEGSNLMGTIALTTEANELIRQSKATGLSLGLSKDLREVREVSLVSRPRIAGARLFSHERTRFFGRLDPAETIDWRAEYESLAAQQQTDALSARLDQLLKSGRLLPAQRPAAAALMQLNETVVFSGETKTPGELVIELIENGPKHELFSQTAPEGPGKPPARMNPDAAAFYSRHFPDLSLDEIAKRAARDGKNQK
jgi:hypothetical protein